MWSLHAGKSALNTFLSPVLDRLRLRTRHTVRHVTLDASGTRVTGVRYRTAGGEARQIDTDFVFIGTGERPDLSMYAPLGLATDERGFVIADTHMRTSVPGVYAAGDLVGPPMEMFK